MCITSRSCTNSQLVLAVGNWPTCIRPDLNPGLLALLGRRSCYHYTIQQIIELKLNYLLLGGVFFGRILMYWSASRVQEICFVRFL